MSHPAYSYCRNVSPRGITTPSVTDGPPTSVYIRLYTQRRRGGPPDSGYCKGFGGRSGIRQGR